MSNQDTYKGHSNEWLVKQLMYKDSLIDNLSKQLALLSGVDKVEIYPKDIIIKDKEQQQWSFCKILEGL
jgi:hypothetical protein